jgi:hypothetical protein
MATVVAGSPNLQVGDLQIPMELLVSPRDKVTVNIPQTLNKRIDELSTELALTKSLLVLLGVAFVIKLLDDWMKEK